MGSALLDASNKRHWELIQQTEGGTAWLLKHFEDYASALAQNMRQTYLSPFTIVTPNIGEGTGMGTGTGVCPWVWGCWGGGGVQGHMHTWGHGHACAQGCGSGDTCAPGDTGLCACLGTWACVCPGAVNPGVPKDGDMCASRDTHVPRDMAVRTPVDTSIVFPLRVPRGLVCAWGQLHR